MTYQPVEDIHRIDLGHHGLIEASAGTGKTYTIENLVVRLLTEERDVNLENILIVTFTEKAASELKVRIREKVEGVLDHPGLDPATVKKLRLCVDEFDKAAIHTIHGFCQGVLRDFALENSAPFRSEVVQDGPLYETLLKEQMRRSWPQRYGRDLKDILEFSRFNERPGEFQKTVLRLSMSLNERAGDRLLPDLGERDFQRIKEEIVSVCMKVKSLIQPKFSHRYDQLNFNARAKGSVLQKMVVPLEDYFSGLKPETFDLGTFWAFMAGIKEMRSSQRKGLDCLIPEKWNKEGDNLQVCPELAATKEGLEDAAHRLEALRTLLTVETVYRLQADVALTKQIHGWISYADMLNLVETALHDQGAADLLRRLRDRFRAAFIDEFQDTDPVQWRIFKKIFIDGPDASGNRLFVIGDPKQAIYAFRGADVYAYLSAKIEMEGIAEGKAGPYSLAVNWRSQPPLIRAFNRLFCRDAWFKPQTAAGRFEIGYQATKAPGPGKALAEMVSDDSGRPPLTIVDLSPSPSPKPAKLTFARFVAQEIQHLMGSDIRIWERGKGEREIGCGDMAILVRGRSDVPFLEDELKKENIPYAFYKKPGLFHSDEAMYTRMVFHAILDPGDGSAVKQALLTPFFDRQVQELYAYDEMPPTHPVKEILFRWNGYAMTRQWGYLFQSLMEDSGLLARGAGSIGWDRQYANYRQIFEYLEEVAYRKNLDFRGVSALLDLHQNALWEAEEGRDIHQIATESGKVQIMTMHVSKGLQFPVVFVAGGLTQPASHHEAYHVYHPVHEGRPFPGMTRVFDLLKSGGEGRHEIEKADEDKRLYYVAATRAQFKLYLPFYTYKNQATWLGPVCTLLSPALMEAFPRESKGQEVLWLTADSSTYGAAASVQSAIIGPKESLPLAVGFDDLVIPQSYAKRRTRVDSFSSLHQERGLAAYPDLPGDISFQPDQPEKEPDEPLSPLFSGNLSEADGSDEIPGGTDTGLMFHNILERMDYGVALRWCVEGGGAGKCLLQDPGTREIILREMTAYRVDARWQEAVCRILWNTLTTPIPPFSDGFTLARLKSEDRLHEAAFYYPFSRVSDGLGLAEGKKQPNRLIRGFIDLIFRKDEKYYVADWKSNHLETGYHQESMARSMAESDYHLQYKLYAVAALRWLKQSLKDRFIPETHWGGVFYFYLRGMGRAGGEGIYYVPPDRLGALGQLEKDVASMLDS